MSRSNNVRKQDTKLRKAQAFLQQNDLANVQALCSKMVMDNPRNSRAQLLLGIAQARQGNIYEAEQHLQQAVDIDPNLESGWLSLGHLYEFQKQYTLAEESLLRSLAIKPTLFDARESLGRIYTITGRIDDAIKQFRLALEQSPDRLDALSGLTKALQIVGRIPEAYQVCMQALSIAPDNAIILETMGQIYRDMGKLEESLKYFRKALQLSPDYESAIYSEADILERMGQSEQALALLQPMLPRLDNDPDLLILYARICNRLHLDVPIVEHLNHALKNQSLYFRSRVQIHFLLGDLLDKQACYEDAFLHFKTGNQLFKQHLDESKYYDTIDNIISCFDALDGPLAPKSETSGITPIFIVGMPRSGTSLVEQILASHPQVYGAGEVNYIGLIAANLEYPDKAFKLDVSILQTMARQYMDALDKHSGGALFVTDKMPDNFLYLGLIALLFPNAKIIHTRRNPLDTCLSCYFKFFAGSHEYSYDLKELGLYYRKYEKLMNYWQHRGISFLDVHYENLINDLEGVSRQMTGYCGLEWSEACLNFHQSKRVVGTASYNQVNKPIYTTSIGRWKHYQNFLAPLREGLDMSS